MPHTRAACPPPSGIGTDDLFLQVKAQLLEDSVLKDLCRLFCQAEAQKNTQLSCLEQHVKIKSAQTEQAIFNSQELRLRLSKVEEEKANIKFQVRIEEHRTSLEISSIAGPGLPDKSPTRPIGKATKKVDKERRLIATQLGEATDTQSHLREELVNTWEQGKERVQNVYDEAGIQMQKLHEQLEMKEKNNSALRKSNAAWALIHSS